MPSARTVLLGALLAGGALMGAVLLAKRVAGVLDFATRVVFASWVGLLSVHARRVGLFTTFLGYWVP